MEIDITLNDEKQITSNSRVIGKTSENKATILKFHVTDKIATLNFYLDFQKPDGSKFTTQKLNIVNNIVEYEITNSLLDEDGYLRIEVVLTDNNNLKIIYPTLTFKIENSINATNELAPENKTLISEIEEVLNKIDDSGTGTKYLSDDGTYKEISGGTTDYDSLDNQPIKRIVNMDSDNPTILRNLDSGAYLFHGWFRPYTGSNIISAAQTPIIAIVARSSDTSYIQLFFPYNNMVQYFEITDNSYNDNQISFNDLLSRIEALENANK